MEPNKKTPKNAEQFGCENCLFKCCKKSDWERHLTTLKHENLTNPNFLGITPNDRLFKCHCGKLYKHASTLSAHKKKCKEETVFIAEPAEPAEPAENENVIGLFIKENTDFKHLILEILKNNTALQKQNQDLQKQNQDFQEKMLAGSTGTSIGNVNNINSHNKTFNMQFFLNEQCKDAMNIKDFMDSFQLQFADLERIGEIGYVDGISELIIKKLNEMDIYKRPIHCSDTKRDIMFVRAENVWEKETNGHDRLRLFIKQITHKNIKLIPLWTETHPQAKDHQHPLNDNYLGMVSQAMGGRGNLEESENKIIKRIAKTVYIDKYQI